MPAPITAARSRSSRPAFSDDQLSKAKELIQLQSKIADDLNGVKHEDLPDAQAESEAKDFLKSKKNKTNLNTLLQKARGDATLIDVRKEKEKAEAEKFNGALIANFAHTGGPNGYLNKADENQNGLGSITLVGIANWKPSIIGASLAFHYSGGKTDPLNGVPLRFHYLGGENKETGSAFAVDEIAVTADIPIIKKDKDRKYDALTLNLKCGIVDPDPRDDLSDSAVLALSGSTYSLAKYSPIYYAPVGCYGKLLGKVSPSVSMYLAGAVGKLPEYAISNEAKVAAEKDGLGDEVVSKEVRAGVQWDANPEKPMSSHFVAIQGQYHKGNNASYGAYGTAQFFVTDSTFIQGSLRAFSLSDDAKGDVAVYGAFGHKFSSAITALAYTSYVNRTHNEVLAADGTAGIDVNGKPVPDNGTMKDQSGVSIAQFGGELIWKFTDGLKAKAVLGGLRTTPQAGSEEAPEWRSYLSASLTYSF